MNVAPRDGKTLIRLGADRSQLAGGLFGGIVGGVGGGFGANVGWMIPTLLHLPWVGGARRCGAGRPRRLRAGPGHLRHQRPRPRPEAGRRWRTGSRPSRSRRRAAVTALRGDAESARPLAKPLRRGRVADMHPGRCPRMAHPSRLGRVLLVSSDPLVRAGLAGLLAESGIGVTVEAGAPVDAVVWDTASAPPPPLGPGAPRRPRAGAGRAGRPARRSPAVRPGSVLRTADAATLQAALLAVSRGLVVLEHGFASLRPAPEARPAASAEAFTPREREVLALLGPRPLQPRHRRRAGDQRPHREVPRELHPPEARGGAADRGGGPGRADGPGHALTRGPARMGRIAASPSGRCGAPGRLVAFSP